MNTIRWISLYLSMAAKLVLTVLKAVREAVTNILI